MSGRDRSQESLADALFGELRGAFRDIRQKLIEEGWFGRVVSAKPVVEVNQAAPAEPGIQGASRRTEFDDALSRAPDEPFEPPKSFEDLWMPHETEHQRRQRQRGEHDMDR